MAGKEVSTINPLDYLKTHFNIEPEHITYDPNVVKDYDIIRGSKHDGTLLFTLENINRCLEPLVNRSSYYKPVDPGKAENRRYTIGDIEITQEFKRVDLPCGNFPGQEEVVKIPVKFTVAPQTA